MEVLSSRQTPREFRSRHHMSPQVSRTLNRRQRDYYRKYEEQLARGRPSSSWRQCRDRKCFTARCLYVDLVFFPMHKTMYGKKKKLSVARRTGLFYDAMAKHLFGENLSPAAKLDKRQLIKSFVTSPPVQGALGQFEMISEDRDMNPASITLAKALTRIRHAVKYLVSRTRIRKSYPDVHDFFGGDFAWYPYWDLSHLAFQFCAVAEAWRRYALGFGPAWEFDGADDQVVADFLLSILMDFHSMSRRGAVFIKRHNMLLLNEAWEKWLDRYHMLRKVRVGVGEHEKPTGEAECFEGYGRGSLPWMSERMKEGCDWYTDDEDSDGDEGV